MFEDSSDEEKPTDEAYLTKRIQTLRNQVKANIMTDSLKTIIFEKIDKAKKEPLSPPGPPK